MKWRDDYPDFDDPQPRRTWTWESGWDEEDDDDWDDDEEEEEDET